MIRRLALAALVATLPLGSAWASNCSSNPFTLTNGQVADASQVMSNFNNLLNCANNNLAHNGANSDITSILGLTTPLSVAQGGTGDATLTANNLLVGNGVSAVTFIAPSTNGNVLTSNGTVWASAVAAVSGITSVLDATNGGIKSVNSTTNATINFQPSDLLTKLNPTTADSIVIADVAASSVGKTVTITSLFSLQQQLPTVIFQDRKATTTGGGNYTQNVYTDHDVNLMILNTIGGVTAVSTPNMTLPAGTYDVVAYAGITPGATSDVTRMRLFNTTDAATQVDINGNDIVNMNSTAQSGASLFNVLIPPLQARFTIAAQKQMKIQVWNNQVGATAGSATNGTGNTEPEVYMTVVFTKVG